MAKTFLPEFLPEKVKQSTILSTIGH